jgi:hypothetical protein
MTPVARYLTTASSEFEVDAIRGRLSEAGIQIAASMLQEQRRSAEARIDALREATFQDNQGGLQAPRLRATL